MPLGISMKYFQRLNIMGIPIFPTQDSYKRNSHNFLHVWIESQREPFHKPITKGGLHIIIRSYRQKKVLATTSQKKTCSD